MEKCQTCRGTGEVHSHNPKCWDCDGKGMIPSKQTECEKRIAAAESGMLDAASEWTKAWQIIAQALKEMRCADCDGNARAIIARLAAENMLIVGVHNVKD